MVLGIEHKRGGREAGTAQKSDGTPCGWLEAVQAVLEIRAGSLVRTHTQAPTHEQQD